MQRSGLPGRVCLSLLLLRLSVCLPVVSTNTVRLVPSRTPRSSVCPQLTLSVLLSVCLSQLPPFCSAKPDTSFVDVSAGDGHAVCIGKSGRVYSLGEFSLPVFSSLFSLSFALSVGLQTLYVFALHLHLHYHYHHHSYYHYHYHYCYYCYYLQARLAAQTMSESSAGAADTSLRASQVKPFRSQILCSRPSKH